MSVFDDIFGPSNTQLANASRDTSAAIGALVGLLVGKGVFTLAEFEQLKLQIQTEIDQYLAAKEEQMRTRWREYYAARGRGENPPMPHME